MNMSRSVCRRLPRLSEAFFPSGMEAAALRGYRTTTTTLPAVYLLCPDSRSTASCPCDPPPPPPLYKPPHPFRFTLLYRPLPPPPPCPPLPPAHFLSCTMPPSLSWTSPIQKRPRKFCTKPARNLVFSTSSITACPRASSTRCCPSPRYLHGTASPLDLSSICSTLLLSFPSPSSSRSSAYTPLRSPLPRSLPSLPP